ncbi:unnamed protein product [Gongylonema pulchrum]|uniref:Cse1 domain-containing protein n=1 Tax=Gongylonema pulchrum TaxID=637853 RepID=A0A183D745_9BILA|nr:unnamed protein product [Gongylonema pulchrum]
MGKYDFPADWPDLITVLAQNLTVESDKLLATLAALDELCRHFRHEMKSEKLWRELLIVLQAVAAPLTDLFTKLLECLPNDSAPEAQCQTWLEHISLITKCFLSLNSQDLPEYFEVNLNFFALTSYLKISS